MIICKYLPCREHSHLICHLSADKSWALVETSFAFGWMPVEDCALVDENFIKTWESGSYAVIIKDKTSIFDADGNFSLRTSIGQMFPLVNKWLINWKY